ncbi:MAG: fructose PTS transporter subunit IIA [Bacilli bacterium]|nr:fructose PTS transporter subunit IIA [Bacilli bacterium]
MKITDLLSPKTIVLNATAKDKNEIIKKAVATIKNSGAIKNITTYSKLVYAREEKSTTGVGDGIAIPHAKSKVVSKPALAALVIRDGVDYKSLDGEKVNLLFLIAAPDSKDNVHLDVLARLSNLLMHPEFKEALL